LGFWTYREHLSLANRLRRSYYELLRDQLDQEILQYALVDSYANFKARKIPYPFVERRELKPKARIPSLEYEAQNAFLVIFVEDTIPAIHKKYIRFFDDNKTTKVNLLKTKTLSLANTFDRSQKYIESAEFVNVLRQLLSVDYALLIQRDPMSRGRDRYNLSHFHVRIDWPIADAAEDMARRLRYISKDLYEKGDKYAEDVQKKFFEYYAQPMMAGGRRTAAIVAAQYLRRLPCISTVYAGSSESRSLIRLSERGVSKATLVRFSDEETRALADENHMSVSTFRKHYAVAREGKNAVFVLQVLYSRTQHAKPPEDGKLREINPDPYWVTVGSQRILPMVEAWLYPPLPVNLIYA
jgi:hypothetical protein